MEDDGKLIIGSIIVISSLIMIGIINPFLLILIITIIIHMQS